MDFTLPTLLTKYVVNGRIANILISPIYELDLEKKVMKLSRLKIISLYSHKNTNKVEIANADQSDLFGSNLIAKNENGITRIICINSSYE
jgi:hypothetical protein